MPQMWGRICGHRCGPEEGRWRCHMPLLLVVDQGYFRSGEWSGSLVELGCTIKFIVEKWILVINKSVIINNETLKT